MTSSRLSFEIKVHGFLLWASFGFLLPLGVIFIRICQRENSSTRMIRILVNVHAVLQIISVVLVTIGAVMSLKNFENSFTNDHQKVGLGLYILVWLQLLLGIFRSPRGSKRRSLWYFVHWLLGVGVCLLGVINIYSGLQAYQRKMRTSPSKSRIWTALFTSEITLFFFVYLLQEKWDYFRKQRVLILGHVPDAPQQYTHEHQLKDSSSQNL